MANQIKMEWGEPNFEVQKTAYLCGKRSIRFRKKWWYSKLVAGVRIERTTSRLWAWRATTALPRDMCDLLDRVYDDPLLESSSFFPLLTDSLLYFHFCPSSLFTDRPQDLQHICHLFSAWIFYEFFDLFSELVHETENIFFVFGDMTS